MNKSKHTPGPWVVEYRPDGKLGIKAGSACLIAMVGRQAASHVDNAYLIASSPNCLSALNLILSDNRLMNAMTREQSTAILDAIAKATGAEND